jgi:hypothetical protein
MLRKYVWQFLGALLALGAIFSTYDVFIRSRPVRGLQVILNSAGPLVNRKPLTPGEVQSFPNLQLTINNYAVANAIIYDVTVKNTGNQPIIESDYSKPLAFYFSTKDEILDISITSSDPPNIGMVVKKISAYQSEAAPVLLNPGDTVAIRFLVAVTDLTNLSDHFHINGRIVGVKAIELVTSPRTVRAARDLMKPVILSLAGVLAGIFSSVAYEKLLGWRRKPVLVEKENPDQAPII